MNTYKVLFEHNKNLLERLDKKDVKTKYLHKEDVFIMTLEEAGTSDSVEIFDGLIVIHFNPENHNIVGFTVPYVQEFLNASKHTFKPIAKKEEREIQPIRVASAAQAGLAYAF